MPSSKDANKRRAGISKYFQEKGKGGGLGSLLEKIRDAMPDFGGDEEAPAKKVRKEAPVSRKKAAAFMKGFRGE